MVEITPNTIIELVNSPLYSLIDSGFSRSYIKTELRNQGYSFADTTFKKVYDAYVGGSRIDLAYYADFETPDYSLFNQSSKIIPGNYGVVAEVGYFDKETGEDKTTLWFYWFDDENSIEDIKLGIADDFETFYLAGRGNVTFVNLIQGYVS